MYNHEFLKYSGARSTWVLKEHVYLFIALRTSKRYLGTRYFNTKCKYLVMEYRLQLLQVFAELCLGFIRTALIPEPPLRALILTGCTITCIIYIIQSACPLTSLTSCTRNPVHNTFAHRLYMYINSHPSRLRRPPDLIYHIYPCQPRWKLSGLCCDEVQWKVTTGV